jgi:hypothetical protein
MQWAERYRFGALGAQSDGHSSCWPKESPSPGPTSWIGWLWQRIAAGRRQHPYDRPGIPLGYRWCDATERRMIDELIGVHRRPFRR